ncbi:TPA: sugar ABC transporter ATP-binding protein [Candidatus Bathyarchaeota archaeon]|nr:sugar ABC transporter ATP-binding protein [Candidatus Bathyarchaeota archaeon]
MGESAPLVKMVNIHKWFGKVYALKGVNFTVNHAEVVGLVGDNGAGKSTLIKILSGIYPPDEGKIYFEGKEVRFSSPKEAMKLGIETIHQDIVLASLMSIARNIFMGRELENRVGIIKLLDLKKMREESIKALSDIGLFITDPDTIVENLSGGQRQGVAIARAMYFKTKLLILDEPTNNLSVKESARVLEFIKGLKNAGISSIFITHNLHHVYPVADRIVVLSHGRNVGTFRKEETSIEHITQMITAE